MGLNFSDLSLDDYFKAIINPSIKKDIKRMIDQGNVGLKTTEKSWFSGHSHSWLVKFVTEGIDRSLFCKSFFPPTEGIGYYQLLHDPNRLHSREKRSAQIIYNNISKQIIGGLGGPLVPCLYGSDDERLILFFEYLQGRTDREEFLEIAKIADPQERERKRVEFLYSRVKNIARFDGLVNAHSEQFSNFAETNQLPSDAWSELLFDDLLNIKRHALNPSKSYDPRAIAELKAQLNSQGVDVFGRVHDLSTLKDSLEERIKLQHGDCRVQHAINSQFVDLELFGNHPEGRDLVTYFSAEGGIAQPPIEEFPRILALYLAYEQAYEHADSKKRKDVVEELESHPIGEMPSRVDVKTYANFMMGVLAATIVENIHLDATVKRYDPDHLGTFIQGIPNYGIEQLEKDRWNYIGQLFELVGEQNTMINLCNNPGAVKKYFYFLGDLLNRMELVELDPALLKKIGNGYATNNPK